MQRLTLPWLALAVWLPGAYAQETELAPGQAIVRRIGGGARHAYRYQLQKGQFARLAVTQRGVELLASVADHAGQQVSLGAITGPVSRFSIPVLAAGSGAHRLWLQPLQDKAPEREYEIRLSLAEAPGAEQQASVRAWHLLREASENQAAMTGEQRKQAIGTAERALAAWREAGDRDGELATLITLAHHQRAADNHREVVRWAAAALPLARGDLGLRSAEAIVLNQGGLAKLQTGAGEAGLADLTASHSLWKQLGDAAGLAYITAQRGYAYALLGDWKQAEPLLRETVEHSRATGDARLVASSQITLARLLSQQKRHREALAPLEQALRFYEAEDDLRNQAFVLNRQGEVLNELGEAAQAFERFDKAVALSRRAGNPSVLTSALADLALRHRRAGRMERALELLEEIRAIEQASGDPSGEALATGRIATVERDLGRLADARRHAAEAVQISESIRAGLANPTLRALSTARRTGAYEVQVDILHRSHLAEPAAGHAAAALAVSERSRARGLLDTIVAAQVNLRDGVDRALLDEEAAILRRLTAKAAEQRKLAMAHGQTDAVR
ncbi:MAG: tetratricopeptide repeat protein, partial [Bryobacterales bacterium]|nr:tetratricopeptide repeat protein [Bryobacterales bacterium]